MKTTINNRYSSISKETMMQLTSVIKETIATFEHTQQPIFTAADLWNIQRQTKARRIRRAF